MTTAEPGSSTKAFRSDIQALRAVAVVLVLLDHLVNRPSGGFIGVDVFFVISGYLISGLLLREVGRTGRVSLRGFYVRRVRRILPMALLVLAVTVLMSYAVLLRSKAHTALVDSLWAGGFLANVHFAAVGTDYFSQGSAPSPLQHYWSLSVEEQFYAVWPLTLLVLAWLWRKRGGAAGKRSVGVLAAVICVVSLVYCIHLTSVAQTDAYFSTLTRAWELGLGAVAAAAQTSLLRLPEWLRASAAWLGLAGIGLGTVLIGDQTAFPGYAALLPVVSTAAVLAAGHPRLGPGRSLLLNNPLVQYVGNVSYSLYLWHWPCIVLAAAYFGSGTAKFYVAGSALPLALSVLSFQLIEDPIRRSLWLSPKPSSYRRTTMRSWYAQSRRGLDAALVSLAVIGFFLAGFLSAPTSTDAAEHSGAAVGTLPSAVAAQLSPQQRRVAAALLVRKWGTLHPSLDSLAHAGVGCTDVSADNVDSCATGDRSGTQTIAVLGDSLAAAWVPTIVAATRSDHTRVQLLSMSECPAPDLRTWRNRSSRDVEYQACTDHRRWAMDWIGSHKPDLVVLASLPDFANRIVGVSGGQRLPAWQEGTRKRVAEIQALGSRVLVLSAPPNTGNLQTCVTRVSTPADCVKRVIPFSRSVAGAERAAAAQSGAAYVDPLDWFCYKGACPAVVDDIPVMRDGTHGTPEYMATLGPLLRPVLAGRVRTVLPST
jgi:peptidoglycan/LPS O-acetylase OafA/YrhL